MCTNKSKSDHSDIVQYKSQRLSTRMILSIRITRRWRLRIFGRRVPRKPYNNNNNLIYHFCFKKNGRRVPRKPSMLALREPLWPTGMILSYYDNFNDIMLWRAILLYFLWPIGMGMTLLHYDDFNDKNGTAEPLWPTGMGMMLTTQCSLRGCLPDEWLMYLERETHTERERERERERTCTRALTFENFRQVWYALHRALHGSPPGQSRWLSALVRDSSCRQDRGGPKS